MLAGAVRLDSPPCVLGDGLALPFPTDTFDLVALITTLEFVADPLPALREAMRVARSGLILGVLNRHSWLGRRLKRSAEPLWQAARFFTPADLAHLAGRAAGSEEAGLDVEPGAMSTIVTGEDAAVFAALQEAFQNAAAQGQMVMIVTFSNACPVPSRSTESIACEGVQSPEHHRDEAVTTSVKG